MALVLASLQVGASSSVPFALTTSKSIIHDSIKVARFDPFLSLDCALRPPTQRNQRKGRDQILQRSGTIVLQA